jgi:lipopolysaccharide transport system permease protein
VALEVSLLLAALNVRYRDVRFAVPFVLQLLFFVTPIVYPPTLLHGGWRLVAGINPMAGVVDGFRWCVLGTTPSLGMIAVSIAATVALAFVALAYFGRVERTFADVI